MKTVLFIFRRDLRNIDNIGLIQAYKDYDKVIPCFIYDPRQVGSENKYRSKRAIEFMTSAVNHLAKSLSGFKIFNGLPENIVKRYCRSNKIDAVYVNKDYTDFSIKRDSEIQKICKQYNVLFCSFQDQLLIGSVRSIKSGSGSPYKKFTPFYNKAKNIRIKVNKNIIGRKLRGPREDARHILLTFNFASYNNDNYCTTKLSVYIKFGVISIREAWERGNSKFRRQLLWRDFWTYINYWFPDEYKYAGIKWNNSESDFKKWTDSKTGFPIIDAAMKQLRTEGFIHNRLRMIVASFLVKDLLIDWRKGEKWFSKQLRDIDMAVNRGNWMSTTGFGHSALPYFRVFNPWLSQRKWDPECEYIFKWIPELKSIPCEDIHKWNETFMNYHVYYAPIIDHDKQKKTFLKRF